jgi:hypothetical protein
MDWHTSGRPYPSSTKRVYCESLGIVPSAVQSIWIKSRHYADSKLAGPHVNRMGVLHPGGRSPDTLLASAD